MPSDTPSSPLVRLDQPPVIVYGALRSGTTLLRLLLDSHGQIDNPGEADFLFDYIRPDPSHPTGWRYDVAALRDNRIFQAKDLDLPDGIDGRDLLDDLCQQFAGKADGALTLNIHRHAERMLDLMPNLRIIHVVRDPRDVAGSVIGMGWAGTYLHGVGPWLGTETAWEGIAARLAPEQVFELRYEALLTDTQATLEALCVFLGVPYDPAMLDFFKTSTYEAIDPKFASKWRRKLSAYDVGLIEGRAGEMMAKRGYAPTGEGIRPTGLARKRLDLRNKLYVWGFGMRRYGIGLYWGEKLTRWAGLTSWHDALKARTTAITIQHLK